MKLRKPRVIAGIAALVLAGSLGFAGSAHAFSETEQALYYDSNWCATSTGSSAYDPIVLGVCAGAGTQLFYLVVESGNTFEIVNSINGLCDTFDGANGGPDGPAIVEGVCANAITQRWEYYTGPSGGTDRLYWLPGVKDNHGNYIAFDDANDVLKAYNKIDGSFFAPGYDSENWTELYT